MMNPNISCVEIRILIGEYALGEHACLDSEERMHVEAHLSECVECRKHFESIQQALHYIESFRNVNIPENVLERSSRQINTMLNQKLMTMNSKRKEQIQVTDTAISAQRNDLHQPHQAFLIWRFIASIAASILIAIGVGIFLFGKVQNESKANLTQAVKNPIIHREIISHKKIANQESNAFTNDGLITLNQKQSNVFALSDRMIAAKNSADALTLLQESYNKAKQNKFVGSFVYKQIIKSANELIDRWPNSKEAVESNLLSSRCYTEIAEHNNARDAFIMYADAAGKYERQKALLLNICEQDANTKQETMTSSLIRKEADRLYEQKDYLSALSFYDILLTRYPNTNVGQYSLYQVATYYECIGQNKQAEQTLKLLINKYPNSKWANEALLSLPVVLFNLGHSNEAIETWQDIANAASTPKDKGCGYYNAGVLLVSRGKAFYPEAIRYFKMAIEQSPNTIYARCSEDMLGKLTNEMMDGVLENIL